MPGAEPEAKRELRVLLSSDQTPLTDLKKLFNLSSIFLVYLSIGVSTTENLVASETMEVILSI